jgi:hypothetical protein
MPDAFVGKFVMTRLYTGEVIIPINAAVRRPCRRKAGTGDAKTPDSVP